MASNRPIPIERETKVQGQVIDKPVEQLYTYQNANEDKDRINAAINFLPIFIVSDDDGYIEGYVVISGDIHYNILTDKHIGAILQLGSGVSYAEYDPSLSDEATMFSKDLDEIIIMQAATHDPMQFTPNTAYLLFPR